MKAPEISPDWMKPAVIERINRARGTYLANTAKEVHWSDLAELLDWSVSTTTDAKNPKKRPFTIEECGRIAALLGVRAGWLAFGELPMSDAGDVAPYYPLTPGPTDPPPTLRVAEGGPSRPAIRGGGGSSRSAPPASPRRRPK